MNMIDAVKAVFGKYGTFSGRALRSEFWWFQLFIILAAIGLGILDLLIFDVNTSDNGPLGSAWSLATLVPNFSAGARRLHDSDRSGWWQLLWLVPIIGWGFLLYWLIRRGDDGANRFGNHPFLPDESVFQ